MNKTKIIEEMNKEMESEIIKQVAEKLKEIPDLVVYWLHVNPYSNQSCYMDIMDSDLMFSTLQTINSLVKVFSISQKGSGYRLHIQGVR